MRNTLVAESARALSLVMRTRKSEQEALEAVLDALTPIFEGAALTDDGRPGALLVVSDNAGSATAVQFWSGALSVGPALASPGAFPWCLANAPCATIARRFAVTGPNITWMAALTSPRTAFEAPAAWLVNYLLTSQDEASAHVWLVALHFGADARLTAWHWTRSDLESELTHDASALAFAIRDDIAREWAHFSNTDN